MNIHINIFLSLKIHFVFANSAQNPMEFNLFVNHLGLNCFLSTSFGISVLKGLKLKYSDYNNKCIDLHCLDHHRSYQYCLVPISVLVADPLVQNFR